MESPRFVYKIVPTAPPEPIPKAYPLSDLDKKDGFIHLSTATQVPNTADLFFSSHSDLWLIKFELTKFVDPIKWEDSFPHLYGNFGKKDVESVQKFERSEGKTWKQVMEGSSWLV
ncbi:hypothetical protein VFPFJ_08696 [Purpureocillium lilacinum]|uniref:DUF952 domain-containing protein n=2 Tax=Purpureocillium lilacinum TaxID=33203 RepID=A0A179H047_PURLI|nr:hypothetical protein VFPFJ_08696 [Purpureocillium lilacinum]KAK4089845.1 hypothetical protein Purlil1_5948 [Purpureocillium lilacinum]OAQ74783.1 hypothetical protein VFPBJ_10078 [Purpureocillium lilacinum]OAQ82893.1 hypothetical protein VFPFJ_08696 [Purpureocillium lilacinum]